MNHSLRTSRLVRILLPLLAVSLILYTLADRYLIEHVEIANASTYAATVTAIAEISSQAQTVSLQPVPVSTATATPEATPAQAAITYDDWNYTSGRLNIAIQKVVSGSGSNQLTYYVADVMLADATQLASAFADNQFGRNIIAYTSAIAGQNNAIFAVNGDYYGFRSDGILIRNGVIYRDVPARTGLAFYRDGSMQIYDETQTSAQKLLDAGVWNTLSFGPALVLDGQAVTDFSTVAIDHNLGNHSIQGNNPRTGIGIIDANHFVFVVVDGRSKGYSRGASLEEFAQIFADLGCSAAYNIDGGGSSTMYFMGRVVNNPLGKDQERGTSDILYIGG